MSVKPNPTVVGIFVLGAIAFSVVGLIFLGQAAFYRTNYRFVTYFDETVSGLEVGAAVKFRGVKIGQVTELKIFLGETDGEGVSSRIPVIYEIRSESFEETFGSLIDLSKADELRRYIDEGLRARLATASLITGLMYVELDIVDPRQYPSEYYSQFSEIYEIPAFKGSLAELSDNVSDFIERFNRIDLEGISLRLTTLLETLNEEVRNADLGNLSARLQETAQSITTLVESPRIPKLLSEMENTLLEYKGLATEMRAAVNPVSEEAQATLKQMTKTLQNLEMSSNSLYVMVRPQSSVRTNLDDTLVRLADAAESLRSLTEYLERNPSALLRGRSASLD